MLLGRCAAERRVSDGESRPACRHRYLRPRLRLAASKCGRSRLRDTASAKANLNRYCSDRGENRSNADRSRISCASVPSRVRLAYG
jgi:hypothetical protein